MICVSLGEFIDTAGKMKIPQHPIDAFDPIDGLHRQIEGLILVDHGLQRQGGL